LGVDAPIPFGAELPDFKAIRKFVVAGHVVIIMDECMVVMVVTG